MSDAVVDNAIYLDDTISLNGVELCVDGPVRGGLVSEFATGLKIGKATYDEREHAFWAVFDDFSGGFGYRQADVREAGGTIWDNDGGVDTRRRRHVTLPPRRYTAIDADNDIGNLISTAGCVPAAVVSDIGGTDFLHIGGGDTIYRMNSARSTLTRSQRLNQAGRTWSQVRRILEFTADDGTRYLFAFGFGASSNNRYYYSTDGTTWTEGDRHAYDGIVWDGLLIVQGLDSSQEALFATADGSTWDVDDTDIGVHWRPGGSVRFIGTAMAPWGASAVYFLDEGKLWVLDWYVYNAIQIEDLGEDLTLTDGVVWNGAIIVTDGWNVYEYNPGNAQTVRSLGPFGKDGMPPSWSSGNYSIAEFLSGTSDLIAVCLSHDGTGETYRLMAFNGTGWSWISPEVSGSSAPLAAIIDRFPINFALTWPSRYVDVLVADRGTLATELQPVALATQGSTPTVDTDQFEDGPLNFETGWFDGGFSELEGVLLKLNIDGYNISDNETVLVEYRLNNNEDSGAYTTLGTFTDRKQTLWFTEDHRGKEFKTVQFRISLDRGSTTTKSPELAALILLFDKKPHARTSWTVRIDVTRTVARGLELEADETATVETIWQFLKSLVNTPRLIELKVPSLESGGLNVRIVDMPATISEINPATGGKGYIELQLIEPTSP